MSAAGPRLSPAPIRRPDDGGQDSDQEREIDRETAQGGAPPRVRPGAPTRRPAQVPPAAGRRPLPAPGPVSGPWPVVAIASASSRRLTRRARQEEGAGTAMSTKESEHYRRLLEVGMAHNVPLCLTPPSVPVVMSFISAIVVAILLPLSQITRSPTKT